MSKIKEKYLGGKDLEKMTLTEREKVLINQMLIKSKKLDQSKENI